MDENEFLAERFEENRTRLKAVAYRMLGSQTEADDAVQEAWIRLSRSDDRQIENLSGWLTTVVGRVSQDRAGPGRTGPGPGRTGPGPGRGRAGSRPGPHPLCRCVEIRPPEAGPRADPARQGLAPSVPGDPLPVPPGDLVADPGGRPPGRRQELVRTTSCWVARVIAT